MKIFLMSNFTFFMTKMIKNEMKKFVELIIRRGSEKRDYHV